MPWMIQRCGDLCFCNCDRRAMKLHDEFREFALIVTALSKGMHAAASGTAWQVCLNAEEKNVQLTIWTFRLAIAQVTSAAYDCTDCSIHHPQATLRSVKRLPCQHVAPFRDRPSLPVKPVNMPLNLAGLQHHRAQSSFPPRFSVKKSYGIGPRIAWPQSCRGRSVCDCFRTAR